MVRTVLLVAALGLALGGCNTAYNYFEDEPDPNATRDDTTFGSILTMTGMVPKPQAPIAYAPRAPLAIPGSTELPPPVDESAAEVAVNFPVDQDEKERERDRAANARGAEAAYEAAAGHDPQHRVSADEVVAGRRAGGGLLRFEDGVIPENEKSTNFMLSREELREGIKKGDDSNLLLTEAGTAAPRQYLIQPPDAYRTPADTAPLPEEGDIENSEWLKKRLYDKDVGRKPERLIQ